MMVRVIKTRTEANTIPKGSDGGKWARKRASRPESSTGMVASKSAVCGVILKYIAFDRRVVLQASMQLLAVQLGLPETGLLMGVHICAILERIH